MRKRILLIEDNDFLREAYADLISKDLNIVILTNKSGRDAIERLEFDSKFDLIISDFIMPNGNGDEVLKYLKEKEIKIPTILFSNLEIIIGEESFPFPLEFVSKDSFSTLFEKIKILLTTS